MYAVAMGTSEWEAFVPRSHMLHLLTLGASFVCCFYYGAPALANLVVPLFLSPRPTNRVGGAIFFCLLINHTIIACLSRRRMSSSSARAGVLRFFVGFI